MYVVLCIQTMSVEFFSLEESSPCIMLCRVCSVYVGRTTYCHSATRKWSWEIVVCVVARLETGSFPSRGKRYLFTKASRLAVVCTQLPFQWVLEALSSRIEQPGHEIDHSPTSSSKVKNGWSCTSVPINAFMMWTGTNFICFTVCKLSTLDNFYLCK
jgi:hypothetical protein